MISVQTPWITVFCAALQPLAKGVSVDTSLKLDSVLTLLVQLLTATLVFHSAQVNVSNVTLVINYQMEHALR